MIRPLKVRFSDGDGTEPLFGPVSAGPEVRSCTRKKMKRLASSFTLWISASTSYNFHDSSWHGSRLSKVQKSNPNKKKCIQILIQTLTNSNISSTEFSRYDSFNPKKTLYAFPVQKVLKRINFSARKKQMNTKIFQNVSRILLTKNRKTVEVSYFQW